MLLFSHDILNTGLHLIIFWYYKTDNVPALLSVVTVTVVACSYFTVFKKKIKITFNLFIIIYYVVVF